MKKLIFFPKLFLYLFLLIPLVSFSQNKQDQIKKAQDAAHFKVIIEKENVEGLFPDFVRFNQDRQISVEEFLPWLRKEYQVTDEFNFILKEVKEDELGFKHHRYSITYRDILLDKAYLFVHSKRNSVVTFNGSSYNIATVDITPKLSVDEARKLAIKHHGAEKYTWETEFWENEIQQRSDNPNATYFPKGELKIGKYEAGSNVSLVYTFDLYPASYETAMRIFVDANNGNIVNAIPLESNCSAASVETIWNGTRGIATDNYTGDTYRLKDDCQSATIRIRDWGSTTLTSSPNEIENTTNTWTTQNEIFGGSVLWAAKESYGYFKNVHSRDSYDDADGDLEGYINAWFDCGASNCTDNASMAFNGSRMKVGLGSNGTLANSWGTLDIIGHEYAHAVTGTSSGLVYQGESGALNESFSDIFGEMIENRSTGTNDWLMGDDRTNGYIRNMSNPKDRNDPDTYLGTNWANTCGTCGDNGGVHTNSGVQNYWFFLVSEGGSGTNDNGDAFSVTGIGIDKASDIAFRNLVVYLGNNSDYFDARDGAIASAIDLYGLCSPEVEAVTNAWYAVGVGDPWITITADVSSYSGFNISCFNGSDGSIDLSIEGGAAPYDYSWTGGSTSQDINGLSAGTYTVTVTDDNGCTKTFSVILSEPTELSIELSSPSFAGGVNIKCKGDASGSIDGDASGGVTPYSFEWSDNASINNRNRFNLPAGTYTVTLTDGNKCEATDQIELTEPAEDVDATNTSDTYIGGWNVSCFGAEDGNIDLTPSGGTPGYTYYWNNGETTQDLDGIGAGDYQVTVKDANLCEFVSEVITLTEPPELTSEITVEPQYAVNPGGEEYTIYLCYGPQSFNLSVTADGGTPGYTYEWAPAISLDVNTGTAVIASPTETTEYTVTVTDQNGCKSESVFTINVVDACCGNNGDKVIVCHVPQGSIDNPTTICIDSVAVAVHLKKGSYLGECDAVAAKMGNDVNNLSDLEMSVYPNPSTGYFSVEVKNNNNEIINNIEVMDVNGRIILSRNLDPETEKIDLTLDNVAGGMYFIRLKTDKANYQRKITIQ